MENVQRSRRRTGDTSMTEGLGRGSQVFSLWKTKNSPRKWYTHNSSSEKATNECPWHEQKQQQQQYKTSQNAIERGGNKLHCQ